jgi:cell division protein FtsA
LGGNDITNDIALGLKVPLEEAENIKLGGLSRSTHSKKKFEEIISARLGDCFELVENHLKKIGRDGLLPAGIILTGGTASTSGIKAFAEESLSLPAHVAEIHFGTNEKNRIRDNTWATACGLALLGFSSSDKESFLSGNKSSLIPGMGQGIFKKISRLISQLLP